MIFFSLVLKGDYFTITHSYHIAWYPGSSQHYLIEIISIYRQEIRLSKNHRMLIDNRPFVIRHTLPPPSLSFSHFSDFFLAILSISKNNRNLRSLAFARRGDLYRYIYIFFLWIFFCFFSFFLSCFFWTPRSSFMKDKPIKYPVWCTHSNGTGLSNKRMQLHTFTSNKRTE